MKKYFIIFFTIFFALLTIGMTSANSSFYQVVGNSMNPVLQEGDFIEVVSEDYQDGDIVVAMKKDGTKIVKRLMGNRLVSVGDGTSYSIDEVTILGAAKYTPMSLAELEEYGFRWETVLGEDEYIVKISAGSDHALALSNKGVVYAWGSNSNGKLGDGTTIDRNVPIRVEDGEMKNTGVTEIEAGNFFSLALKDGTVYAWGLNSNGELGRPDISESSTVPVRVADGVMENTSVTAISAGYNFSLALKEGTVYAWGKNDFGQLGDGTKENQNVPVRVENGAMVNTGVTAIDAGANHSIALKDGSVYTWGNNSNGQLGDGTNENRNTPVKVENGGMGNTDVSVISAVEGGHTFAIKNGTVYAWGKNAFGQLGDGTMKESLTPVKVVDGEMKNTGVTAIDGGERHTIALKDGVVYAWGSNTYGQLDTFIDSIVPKGVADGAMGNTGVTTITAGQYSSFALKNGKVYGWGDNRAGQLGNGTNGTNNKAYEPIKVHRLENVQSPAIVSHPVGSTVTEGEDSPTLTVAANISDGGTLSYQWYKNTTNSNTGGTPIPGAIGASYEVPTDTPETAYYYVKVTNTKDVLFTNTITVKSNVAQVTVIPLVQAATPVITTQPVGAKVYRGSKSPTLTVEAIVSDGGTLSYQWYRNDTNSNTGGTPITGATSESYEVPTDKVGTTYYYVVVTNTNNGVNGDKIATVTSDVVEVKVDAVSYPGGGSDDPPETKEPQPEKPVDTVRFVDIKGHWAEENIQKLLEMGVIKGYSDNTFRPNHLITRAEFVTIIVRLLGLELTGEKTFSDTVNHWAKDVIATAYHHGIISGYNDSVFGANDPITREQIAAIIVNAYNLEQRQDEQKNRFVDQDDISPWAQKSIEIVTSYGILVGYDDGSLKPKNNTTRAEAATILVRLLELQ